MSNEMALVKSEMFGTVECDFWQKADENEIWMTRKQIGEALEYANPQWAIDKIHSKHSDRLDKFSVTTKMVGTDGKQYNTTIYSSKGVYEICRWSRQTKANEFIDWVWNIVDHLKFGNVVSREEVEFMINQMLLPVEKELIKLRKDYGKILYLKSSDKTNQPTIDVVRDTIKPLGEKYADTSKGYTVTLRQVYERMGVGWTHRQTRYMNQHGLKNPPKKINLIARDKNLQKLFKKTVEEMMGE